MKQPVAVLLLVGAALLAAGCDDKASPPAAAPTPVVSSSVNEAGLWHEVLSADRLVMETHGLLVRAQGMEDDLTRPQQALDDAVSRCAAAVAAWKVAGGTVLDGDSRADCLPDPGSPSLAPIEDDPQTGAGEPSPGA